MKSRDLCRRFVVVILFSVFKNIKILVVSLWTNRRLAINSFINLGFTTTELISLLNFNFKIFLFFFFFTQSNFHAVSETNNPTQINISRSHMRKIFAKLRCLGKRLFGFISCHLIIHSLFSQLYGGFFFIL